MKRVARIIIGAMLFFLLKSLWIDHLRLIQVRQRLMDTGMPIQMDDNR